MRLRLNHIGFVTESISDYIEFFEAMGFKDFTEAVESRRQKVNAAFVSVSPAHTVHVELLEPRDENSPISNFLKKRGEGLHHLCFETNDLTGTVNALAGKGFRLVVLPEPAEAYDINLKRQSATPTKAAFLIVGKLLVELYEKGRQKSLEDRAFCRN
jgi:methylmalonyl-CoA/ethylmalonyl-CoA epimerase